MRIVKLCLLIGIAFFLPLMTIAEPTINTILVHLFDSSQHDLPVIVGNPQGKITVVEFTDYNCHYCKMMTPIVNDLLKENKNVRLVIIDYPLLAPSSTNAALAALAANTEKKYLPFHEALMTNAGELNTATINAIAKKMAFDGTTFNTIMQSTTIQKQLANNIAIGDSLEIPGTPTFLIAKTILPGETTATKKITPIINFGYLPKEELIGKINELTS